MNVTCRRWLIILATAGLLMALPRLPIAAQPPTPSPAPRPTASPTTTQTAGATPIFLPLIGQKRSIGTPVFLPFISQSQPSPTSTPTPATPEASVRFARINLRALPGLQWPPTDQLQQDTICAVAGRNRATSWLFLDCPDGTRGWVDVRLVRLAGPLEQAPILFTFGATTPPPAVGPTALPTATMAPTATPTPSPTSLPNFWRAEFFDDAYLTEPPVYTQLVPEIDFYWGDEAPDITLPVNRFSARFLRTQRFSPGYYRFVMRADDGLRFWLDDEMLVDGWLGCCSDTFSVTRWLDGIHDLRVEYYEDRINASIRFAVQEQPNTAAWRAAYYDNARLRDPPLFTQAEPAGFHPLDYAWGESSPVPPRVPADRWSARWQGDFFFESGNYRFHSDTQDGVRVYIDDLLVIDAWRNGRIRTQNSLFGVGAGVHAITVEYYNRAGDARLEVWWEREEGRQIAP